jgi:hypothetical protein
VPDGVRPELDWSKISPQILIEESALELGDLVGKLVREDVVGHEAGSETHRSGAGAGIGIGPWTLVRNALADDDFELRARAIEAVPAVTRRKEVIHLTGEIVGGVHFRDAHRRLVFLAGFLGQRMPQENRAVGIVNVPEQRGMKPVEVVEQFSVSGTDNPSRGRRLGRVGPRQHADFPCEFRLAIQA